MPFQPAITSSKLTIERLELGVKYMFKVNNKDVVSFWYLYC